MAASDIKRNPQYFEEDPENKGHAWGNDMVSLFRREWKSMLNKRDADIRMEYLFAMQSLDHVKKGFREDTAFFKNNKWIQVSVFDRIRNILVAEFLKAMHKPHVEATDVAATIQRKKDASILAGRKDLEVNMTDLNLRTGDPIYKIAADKYEGNVEAFDELGLDDRSLEDRNFFMRIFHRLWHEADAQELLHSLMKYNEFENHVEDIVNDILASKVVSYRLYASPMTGEIKWSYLSPDKIKCIRGKRPDHKDDMCLGWEERLNVRQFLEFAGPDFDWAQHGEALRNAVNLTNGTNYSLVTQEGCFDSYIEVGGSERQHRLVGSYSQLLNHSVDIGYMEFKTVDRTVKKKNTENGLLYPLKKDEKNKELSKKYSKEITKFQKTYRTWFLSTGSDSQMIFHYGPLYHMLTSGAYDEFSSYSIHIYEGKGKSAVQIAEPFIDVIDIAFNKILWALEESTPKITWINYSSVATLVAKLKKNPMDGQSVGAGASSQINSILEHYTKSLTRLYDVPEQEGQKLGGNGRPNYQEDGGLDPLASAMQTVMDWGEAQVAARLGLNSLRDAYSPDPKDGYKLQVEAMKQSRNATYYIPFMLEKVIKNTCTCSLMFAQDAIEFKQTPTYSFLVNLIGEDSMSSFRSLDKIPQHRYGIFVELFSAEEKKRELEMDARLAFERGQITYDQYLMVKEVDDYKRAGMLLMFYRTKAEKKAEEAAKIQHARAMEAMQAKTNGELAVIDRKGQWDVRQEDVRGRWYMLAHREKNETDLQKKEKDIISNPQKQMDKAHAEMAKNEHAINLQHRAPLPVDAEEQTD